MEYRNLGRTGLNVAPLCLGGNVFGWTADQAASEAVLDAYVEGGGNFIDTADIYSIWVDGHIGGESETALGIWMQARGNRDQLVVATKAAGPIGPGPNDKGLSRSHLFRAVEGSLRRLQTDYIDLYQTHFDDPGTPLDETMSALDDLVHQGKVRYLGASNYSAWRLTRALWESDKHHWARFDSLQPLYNLIDREPYERDLEPLCREQGIGVIPYSTLASGFLTGKYTKDGPLPSTPRAGGIRKKHMNDRGWAILASVQAVAEARGATPAQVALAWQMARPGLTAPIASATTAEQTRELLGAADVTLEPSEIEALNTASEWRKE